MLPLLALGGSAIQYIPEIAEKSEATLRTTKDSCMGYSSG